MTLDELKEQAVREAVARHGGNKVKAAEELGVSLKTVYNLLARYGGKRKPEKARTTDMREPTLMIAFRATDPRLCHPITTLRIPCSRCHALCGITPASLDAVEAGGLTVVCMDCLTSEKVLAIQHVTITAAQLAEAQRYHAGLQ